MLSKKTGVSPANITTTESDSGLAVVLYIANHVELDADDFSKTSFVNLLNKTIKCNDGGSSLQELRLEIANFLLVLLEKYSSVCVCDPLLHYPSVFRSASNDASEFANSISQASSSLDNTGDSIWQLSENKSLHSSELASKLSCGICHNDMMSIDNDSLVSKNLTCPNTSMRKISNEDSKDNICMAVNPHLNVSF